MFVVFDVMIMFLNARRPPISHWRLVIVIFDGASGDTDSNAVNLAGTSELWWRRPNVS